MLFLFALIGAALYRLRGMGAWPNKRLWVGLYALPFAYITYKFCGWWPVVPVYGITFGMVLTGHASYIDLGEVKPGAPNSPADGQVDEWYGHWLPFKPASYEHDFLGLVVNGLLITGSCAISLFIYGQTTAGILMLFAGITKAPAYALGQIISAEIKFPSVAMKEVFCGFVMYFMLAQIIFKL